VLSVREDKKCGASGIAENKKCGKGAGTAVGQAPGKLGTRGKTGEALDEQVRNNVAAKLRALINGAPGGKVYAAGDAHIITLTARTVGSAGAFALGLRETGATGNLATLSNPASATGTAVPQRELLLLSGQYAVGDEVVLTGVADEDVVYVLEDDDFTATGNGLGGPASDYQVAHNLATKLKRPAEKRPGFVPPLSEICCSRLAR
jgi:hypothetical protein